MNSERLKPVCDVAEAREDTALREAAAALAALADQEQRLEELRRYLKDYEAAPGPAAISPWLLNNRRGFLAKLQQAIQHQEQVVAAARAASEAQQSRWRLVARDAAVLEKLAESYRGRERQALERAAQRELDEFALRRPAPGVEE